MKYNLRTWLGYLRVKQKKDWLFWLSLSLDILVVLMALSALIYGKPALTALYQYVNDTCFINTDMINMSNITHPYNETLIINTTNL